MSKDLDLGAQAISKAVEVGLKSQLDAVEDLQVNISTDPAKLVQGEVDYVEIKGKGLVMKRDLRAEKLQLATSNISINPLKTVTGEIELEQSVAAKTAVVLTAADIEQALNSEYIQTKLSNLQIRVAGQKTYIKPHQIKFSIPQTDTIWVEADIELVETGEIQQVGFKAQPRMTDSGHQVVLENVELLDAAKEQPELTEALVEVVTELLDLDNFELEDMSLRFERIGVEPGQIKLQAKAKIDSLPA